MLSAVSLSACGQPEYKPIKFFYRPLVGAIFPTRSYSTEYITDNLINSRFQNVLFQPLDIGFFYKQFGLEGHLVLSPAQNNQAAQNQFRKEISLKYGNEYYTTMSSGIIDDYSAGGSDPLVRGSIGPAYKIEKKRLVFIGRVMIGTVTVTTNWARARLKGKNTNELINIDWKTDYANNDCFSINPSFTLAYRMNRRISFNIDLDSWFYKADITYDETITNAVPGTTATNKFRYHHFMNDISIGLGIMVVFK
jgi:hypothetical protein